ncbi:MAG: hypothetical protein EXR50_05640 [Dehalococcoidia bacterium]|nr:hypothetical protein [Dehalococcoidia bacterium]
MRELNSMQAPIVQRIFELFYSGTSCHGIAEELNREGLQALGGGRWHPLTVRRILDNDTYTGRTVYRRTQVQFTRDPHSGKKRRQVQFRDESEWIEIHGATPPIVTSDIYAKAQAILNDPYRRLARKPSGVYRLRGHIRCLSCGTPMVGHALAKGRYRYYRCRRTYSGYAQGSCDSRYISVETLEQTVLCELARVLSEPRVLLSEARRLNGDDGEAVRKTELQRKLNAVEAEQRRLARLYTAGMLPDDILEGESRRLSAQRQRLENERQVLEAKGPNMIDLERLERELPEALTRLRQWVLLATEDDMALILEALQVQIRASNDQVFIEGVIPTSIQSKQDKSVQDFVTIERTWASPRGCNLRSPRA